MQLPGPDVEFATPMLRTLAVNRPMPGILRVTSLLSSVVLQPHWDEQAITAWLQFPGCSPLDYTIRRYDPERGIVDIDFTLGLDNPITAKWLATVEVGSCTPLSPPDAGPFPNFAGGHRVLIFADQHSVPAVVALLEQWPTGVIGFVWLDTPDPLDVASLPVVDGVGVMSFHVDLGFDPLVTAARRVELDGATTVWAAGERSRMEAIRATCLAAGLAENDTRVFGYWADRRERCRS